MKKKHTRRNSSFMMKKAAFFALAMLLATFPAQARRAAPAPSPSPTVTPTPTAPPTPLPAPTAATQPAQYGAACGFSMFTIGQAIPPHENDANYLIADIDAIDPIINGAPPDYVSPVVGFIYVARNGQLFFSPQSAVHYVSIPDGLVFLLPSLATAPSGIPTGLAGYVLPHSPAKQFSVRKCFSAQWNGVVPKS